ncbi:MAG: OFA family MFS transporter [Candidatus Kapabacteria bacterium]|nr:OFA family MFS transporter [Ignavibacteriota bacterium]MCW5884695.1 OFA family MFS transporter [Candidatus Kapabacteria bacterium]
MSLTDSKNKGWFVTSIGLLINLALGILYAWSVLKESILQSINSGDLSGFKCDMASLNDPYAVCILAFAFSMTFAGKLQDKRGPSFTAKIGGLLVGTGFILSSLSTNYYLWIIGFGIMGGTGIGFGYSATTPAALKWFSSAKTGLIAGIVVSGFGLAPVFIAPLASFLVGGFGLQSTMMIFGIVFLIFISGLAFFLKNPPIGYIPKEAVKSNNAQNQPKNQVEYDSIAMLKTLRFYLMWVIFFIGSGAGLMVIGSISGIAKASMGESAFIAVAIMAIGNALGRVVAGVVSDKMAKSSTLFIILVSQSGLMFLCYFIMDTSPSASIIVLIATLIGFNYGANLSLFPSFTKGFWGMKNFGMNYGILMSAWGLGGFVFSRLAQSLFASTGSNNTSFLIAGCCLGLCLYLTVVLLEIKSMN